MMLWSVLGDANSAGRELPPVRRFCSFMQAGRRAVVPVSELPGQRLTGAQDPARDQAREAFQRRPGTRIRLARASD